MTEELRPVSLPEAVSIVMSFPLDDSSRQCMDLGEENASQSAKSGEGVCKRIGRYHLVLITHRNTWNGP